MGIGTAPGALTTDEIVALNREHTFFSWSVQGAIDPIAIDRAEGVWLYTPDGTPDPRLQQPADVGEHRPRRPARHRRDHRAGDEAAVRPARVRDRDPRAGWARSSPRSCPATSTRSSSPSAAPRRSRTRSSSPATTPAATRSSPATARTTAPRSGAMTLTGDPRRWANEPGLVGVVRYPDTHRWGEAEPRPVAESLQGLEDVIRYEGPHTIAAVFLETVVGTNGILIPPDGYIAGRPRDLRPQRHPDGRATR